MRSPKGTSTRPTADRVKEALFSILAGRCEGARVLDLFAGSGALGIEALSRGASRAIFVDKDSAAFSAITANLVVAGFSQCAEVYRVDYRRALDALASRGQAFELAFVDPPYSQGLDSLAIAALSRKGLVALGGMVVVEHSSGEVFEPEDVGLKVIRVEKYGDTSLSFLVEGN